MTVKPFFILLALPLWLAACTPFAPPAQSVLASPGQWQAPLPAISPTLPHNGQLADLSHWWQRFNDPLLLTVIDAAQQVSPTIASSVSRLAQAKASQQFANALLSPQLELTSSTNRGRQISLPGAPLATQAFTRLQTSWETDLFGGLAATRNAAQARSVGAQAQWHEARVTVAAEVANLYFDWRTCQALRDLALADKQSRAVTAKLAQLSTQAGFSTPAAAALARASAAEANSRLTQQQAQCDTTLKGLVALSGLAEADLRQKMQTSQTPWSWPSEATFSIAAIPALALTQRPDLFNAEREVAAASFELGSAEAERYPRLTLGGSVGRLNLRTGSTSFDVGTWSIGPITLTLPLLDGGKFAANLAGAKARYEEADAIYRARARQAVREVEVALVALHSANARQDDLRTVADSYSLALSLAQNSYNSGLGSLADLEDAKRAQLATQSTQLTTERERLSAWIALYRAVGGGWAPPDATTPPQATP